jgi:hypothetical protein
MIIQNNDIWVELFPAGSNFTLTKPGIVPLKLKYSTESPTNTYGTFTASQSLMILPAVHGKSIWALATIGDVEIFTEEML